MGVKRVVDTDFWEDPFVLDHYSVEDKYFYLYLTTNPRSSQLGIFTLPKKTIAFQTGYSLEVVEVLLDRFQDHYQLIRYKQDSQEIALLDSLKSSIIKGGKPVLDCLKKDFSRVKDPQLILAVYQAMTEYWDRSNRPFDASVRQLFEEEVHKRGLSLKEPAPSSQQAIHNEDHKQSHKQKQNHNDIHKQYSPPPMGGYDSSDGKDPVDKPETIPSPGKDPMEAVFSTCWKEVLGYSQAEKDTLRDWSQRMEPACIQEAILRSKEAYKPFAYAMSILRTWQAKGIQTLDQVYQDDRSFYTGCQEPKIHDTDD